VLTSSLSLKMLLLSEWPRITHGRPRSFTIETLSRTTNRQCEPTARGHEQRVGGMAYVISPVKAPSWW
jgi:hypothetical protein